jgi:alkanesulfonate monooxygenase SsuD/methylene tetrahydromethanopterin reductase-like flavin-dependent oxidoreductase (luciferase family)
MSTQSEFLWYIPNEVRSAHRGDTTVSNSLEALTTQATALEDHGWRGALLGAGWGRPDTFTVAAAITARTTTFEPLIAIRPGYWRPAHFAAAAATLDDLSGRRVRINIVSGQDNLAAYGDTEGDQAHRYGRTKEFMRLARRLWTEEEVTHAGEHFQVTGSTVMPRLKARGDGWRDHRKWVAVGQQRLLDLHEQGEVLDDNLYTAPGKYGGGGAGTTWLVGSAADVANSLLKYQQLGITHFVLSDTPYLAEIKRQGDQLLPLLRG